MEFTVDRCRKILGKAADEMTDNQIEELRDFYIAFSDFVIDSEIEKSRLKQNAQSYGNKKISP